MNNIVDFDGETKLDIPPDRILQNAMGEFDRALILGWDKEGRMQLRLSFGDARDALWLLESAKQMVLDECLP